MRGRTDDGKKETVQVVLREKVKCTKGEIKCEGGTMKGHGK